MRELAYELSTKWVWAVRPGLGRIGLGSAGSGLVWGTPAWLACGLAAHSSPRAQAELTGRTFSQAASQLRPAWLAQASQPKPISWAARI